MSHRTLYLIDDSNQCTKLLTNAAIANSFWLRLKGLLGKKYLAYDEALIISPCSRVHTIGMLFSIDVFFLSREGDIVKIVKDVKPNRQVGHRGACSTIEMMSGSAEKYKLKIGDKLSWK